MKTSHGHTRVKLSRERTDSLLPRCFGLYCRASATFLPRHHHQTPPNRPPTPPRPPSTAVDTSNLPARIHQNAHLITCRAPSPEACDTRPSKPPPRVKEVAAAYFPHYCHHQQYHHLRLFISCALAISDNVILNVASSAQAGSVARASPATTAAATKPTTTAAAAAAAGSAATAAATTAAATAIRPSTRCSFALPAISFAAVVTGKCIALPSTSSCKTAATLTPPSIAASSLHEWRLPCASS